MTKPKKLRKEAMMVWSTLNDSQPCTATELIESLKHSKNKEIRNWIKAKVHPEVNISQLLKNLQNRKLARVHHKDPSDGTKYWTTEIAPGPDLETVFIEWFRQQSRLGQKIAVRNAIGYVPGHKPKEELSPEVSKLLEEAMHQIMEVRF